MAANRRRDTSPEIEVRSALHARGLRFRVDYPVLPRRRGDIVFPRQRVVVFIDGCFWHSCPEHGTTAKANATYWADKLKANSRRDRDTNARLSNDGWRVLRFWEHHPPDEVADRIADVVTGQGDPFSAVASEKRRQAQ
jgi:DNA mismatch endonuclease, patch repair protein